MAKIKMLCPFTNEPCKECALYRGRHYYLCFCEKYRGHIDESTESNKECASSNYKNILNITNKILSTIPANAIDPFKKTLKDS